MGRDTLTIYAVSSGSYSDYRVHCLFTKESDAYAYKDRMDASWDRYFIEEFLLDPRDLLDNYAGLNFYKVTQYIGEFQPTKFAEGKPKGLIEVEECYYEGKEFEPDHYGELNKVRRSPHRPMLLVRVAAKDKAHAIKIATDLFRIYKSEETA